MVRSLFFWLFVSVISIAHAGVDKALPEYERVAGISGNFSSMGSDTLSNLMTFWAEDFKRAYPNVNIQIQAAGSSTAPLALTQGMANVGPMSRLMKQNEIAEFERVWGYPPTAVPVAIDAMAVFVHKDNPLNSISLEEVDAIFSATRMCGHEGDIRHWGAMGLKGAWANRRIQLFGRNSVSGTYGYFKERALCRGDFKAQVNEQPGSASVVQSIAHSVNSIGYSGIGYGNSGVRALPLRRGESFLIAPSTANVLSGEYPLARFLYVYVNKPPSRELSPLEREFFALILSRQGQLNVLKDGYVPLPAFVALEALESLGISAR